MSKRKVRRALGQVVHPQVLVITRATDRRNPPAQWTRHLDLPSGCGAVGIDGQRTGPYDGHRWQHRLGPLPDAATNCAGGVPRVRDRPSSRGRVPLSTPAADDAVRDEGCRSIASHHQEVMPLTPALRASSIWREEGVDAFQALQGVLYRSAKQDPERRFHVLYDKLTRCDVMWKAWVSVATDSGAPGVDGVTIASIEGRGCRGSGSLPRRARQGGGGRDLPASAPAAGEHPQARSAEQVQATLNPRCSGSGDHGSGQVHPGTDLRGDFRPCSFGFRPKRSAHQALEKVRTTVRLGA